MCKDFVLSNFSVLSKRSSEQALLRVEVQGGDPDVGLLVGHVLRPQLHAHPSRPEREAVAAAEICVERWRTQF